MGWPDTIEMVNMEEGIYRVRGKVWEVGRRYVLHEHIGAGSYGDVCRASDNDNGQTVAMKRIGDVLMNPMLAKRVLREVCIMRRISHPYIIRLTDVFTRSSREVEGGVDLYIGTEFADGGDMYRMKDQLSENDVKTLLWQLLVGVKHLHSFKVFHRDIKSENTLIKSKTVKVCDFGLARSALGNGPSEYRDMARVPLPTFGSGKASRRVLTRSYTKTVVTPSYRAPEVIMSRGCYDSAIDIWSLGCIFWELLMRQMNPHRLGPPPHPLFGVRGEPVTPVMGQKYVNDCSSSLPEQLDVIFDVIGTPCWTDIEALKSDQWVAYLRRLPGRAGNLALMMSDCDPQAVDLLQRMLSFNPARRCTADEALSHTYFDGMQKPADLDGRGTDDRPVTLPTNVPFWKVADPAVALGLLENELELSATLSDGGKQKLEWLLEREAEGQKLQYLLRRSFISRNLTGVSGTPCYPEMGPPSGQVGDRSMLGSTSFSLSSETPTWPHNAYHHAVASLRDSHYNVVNVAGAHHHHQRQQQQEEQQRCVTSSQDGLWISVGLNTASQGEGEGRLMHFSSSGGTHSGHRHRSDASGRSQETSNHGTAASRPSSARMKMMRIRQGSMLITKELSAGLGGGAEGEGGREAEPSASGSKGEGEDESFAAAMMKLEGLPAPIGTANMPPGFLFSSLSGGAESGGKQQLMSAPLPRLASTGTEVDWTQTGAIRVGILKGGIGEGGGAATTSAGSSEKVNVVQVSNAKGGKDEEGRAKGICKRRSHLACNGLLTTDAVMMRRSPRLHPDDLPLRKRACVTALAQ